MNDTFIVPPAADIDEYSTWDQERWNDRIHLLQQMWRNGFATDEMCRQIIADLIVHSHDFHEE